MRHLIPILALALTLSVTPKVGYPGQPVKITVHHPYEKGDRWLRIGILCNGELMTASDRGLGAKNPPIYPLSFTLREPCEYEIRAMVVTWDDKVTVAKTTVVIKGE